MTVLGAFVERLSRIRFRRGFLDPRFLTSTEGNAA